MYSFTRANRTFLIIAAAITATLLTPTPVSRVHAQPQQQRSDVPTAGFADAFARPERPRIAVYVFGADDPALNKAMATRLIAELSATGRYQTAENYREFFNRVDAERLKGGSVIVSSKRIKDMGRQFRLEYVCVAEIITALGLRQVSAHILSVGDGGITAMGGGDVALRTFADLTIAAEQIIRAMFRNAPPPGYELASLPVSAASPMLAGMNAAPATAEFTDSRDGKTYMAVKIGTQTWMSQNVNYQTQFGSWCYGNDNSNCGKYGRLYGGGAAGRVCPPGWHLPSRQEWDILVAAAGGSAVAGKRLKSAGGWSLGNSGLDDYNFSALPGGSRNARGDFLGIGGNGYWWTGTMGADNNAYYRYMYHDLDGAGEHYDNEGLGFSVRCVSDK
jgi:uncharacterized protein (TIGR02145 family)